jgi:uncharacterized protein (TIGR00730 family)
MANEKDKVDEELIFLDGPQSRTRDLFFLCKVLLDFIRGFRVFHFLGPCVTVFGSARFGENQESYEVARKVGHGLARLGFTVMTGGGPGIMEAANRGAKEAGGLSVGCNIGLPTEQKPNAYLDKWVAINYFFVRKVLLSKYSYAFVVMPGGYGTMDEFFEALTLIQTQKTKKFPVIVIGKKYYENLMKHILILRESGAITAEDFNLFLFTDSVEETISFIYEHAVKHFDLHSKPKIKPKPRWWLGEK